MPVLSGPNEYGIRSGSIYKKKYCEGNKLLCARYMIATTLGPDYVINNIYPNMTEQAQKIIAQHKK